MRWDCDYFAQSNAARMHGHPFVGLACGREKSSGGSFRDALQAQCPLGAAIAASQKQIHTHRSVIFDIADPHVSQQ